jgi:hypothetical protein
MLDNQTYNINKKKNFNTNKEKKTIKTNMTSTSEITRKINIKHTTTT